MRDAVADVGTEVGPSESVSSRSGPTASDEGAIARHRPGDRARRGYGSCGGPPDPRCGVQRTTLNPSREPGKARLRQVTRSVSGTTDRTESTMRIEIVHCPT